MEHTPAPRSFFKKSDLLLILTVVVIAIAAMAGLKIHQQSAAEEVMWAVIDAPSGEYRVNLSRIEGPCSIDLMEAAQLPATLELEPGRCRLVNVDCPDHICEGFGWISASRQTATCMPNRFVVGIYGQQEMGGRMESARDITDLAQ